VSAPVDTEPDGAPPVLKLVPVQDVALVEPQVSNDDPPLKILVGFAESDAVAAGGIAGFTVTVPEPIPKDPNIPEQLIE
jgi:hypothetical protein